MVSSSVLNVELLARLVTMILHSLSPRLTQKKHKIAHTSPRMIASFNSARKMCVVLKKTVSLSVLDVVLLARRWWYQAFFTNRHQL
jgi:hypothetical protein